MSTRGAGGAWWLASSLSSVVRIVESSGGWGDCSSSIAVCPRPRKVGTPRRKAAISQTQKRVGLLSSSERESEAAGEQRYSLVERLGGRERARRLLQLRQREMLHSSEIALAGAASAGMVSIPVRSPAWPLLSVDIERAA